MPNADEGKRDDNPIIKSKHDRHYRSIGKKVSMSALVMLLGFAVTSILFGVAIANWQKGSLWAGLLWGVGGYIFFGVGATVAYYYYIIQPSLSSKANAPEAVRARPYVFCEGSRLQEEFAVGKKPVIIYTFANTGNAEAKVLIKDMSFAWVPTESPKVLTYYAGSTSKFNLAPSERTVVRFAARVVLTEDMYKAITEDHVRFYFFARGEYSVEGGPTFDIQFCREYNRDMPGNLVFCRDDVTFDETKQIETKQE